MDELLLGRRNYKNAGEIYSKKVRSTLFGRKNLKNANQYSSKESINWCFRRKMKIYSILKRLYKNK